MMGWIMIDEQNMKESKIASSFTSLSSMQTTAGEIYPAERQLERVLSETF